MFPTKTLSKILWEKLWIQNSRSNGHLTSFDVLIIAHVIYPTAELLVDSGNEELNWTILAGYKEGNMIPLQIYQYVNICTVSETGVDPSEEERPVYDKVQSVLDDGQVILKDISQYTGATEDIRQVS